MTDGGAMSLTAMFSQVKAETEGTVISLERKKTEDSNRDCRTKHGKVMWLCAWWQCPNSQIFTVLRE